MKRLEEVHPLAEALDKRMLLQTTRHNGTNLTRWHGTSRVYTSSQGPDRKSLGPRAEARLRHQREQRCIHREHAHDQDVHPAG